MDFLKALLSVLSWTGSELGECCPSPDLELATLNLTRRVLGVVLTVVVVTGADVVFCFLRIIFNTFLSPPVFFLNCLSFLVVDEVARVVVMVVVVDIVDVVVVEVVVDVVLGSVVVTFSVVAGGDVESLGTGRLISSPEMR